MPAPPIYLDESVDYSLAEALRQRGFSVFTVQDEGSSGDSDPEQLAYATERDWRLLSHNSRDFRRLHANYQRHQRPHSGISLLPQRSLMALLTLRAAMMLDWLQSLPDYRSQLFTWGQLQSLLERGQRLRGYSDGGASNGRGAPAVRRTY